MFLTVFISCIFLGSVAGFLSGLLGIGGGLIIVPALVYLLPLLNISADLVMPIALATSLSSIVLTSSSAAYAHHRNSNIPWLLTRQLMLWVSVGAVLGAFVAGILSTKILTNVFSGAVLVLASYMLFSIRISKTRIMPTLPIMRVVGLLTGIISSLMGISGAAILIPAFNYFGINVRHAIGIATVCGSMVALFGSIGYIVAGLNKNDLPPWSLGYVYLPALLGIILTSTLLAPLGVKVAGKLPVSTLKKIFAAFLILVSIKMLWH